MNKKTKAKIEDSAVWLVAVSALIIYAILFASFASCSSQQKNVGWTAIQAAKLLEQSAGDHINSLVKQKMNECSQSTGAYEGPQYEKCMADVWKLQKQMETYAKPALESAIIAATAALSTHPKEDKWRDYLKKGVCAVTKIFLQWKNIIPYSNMIAPLFSALGKVTCTK